MNRLTLFLFLLGFSLLISAPAAAAVDINSADAGELATLPGISPDQVNQIIRWRQENGRFATPYDLMKVPGMTGENFQTLLPLISAGAPGDLKPVPPAKPAPRISDNPVDSSTESSSTPTRSNGPRRIGRAPLTPVSLFKAGFGLARRGKFSMAEPLFRQFIDQHSSHALISDAKFLLAGCLEEQEKYTLALDIYQAIAENESSHLQSIALLRCGVCQDLMEKRTEAAAIYRDFLTRTSNPFLQSQWRQTVQDRLNTLTP